VTDPPTGIRGRYRAQVRDEVKRAAMRQLAEGGPQSVSINAIAKELGMTGPALYRYFSRRDQLLTELITDSYRDFAAAIAAATRRHRTSRRRLRALAAAYRAWAIAQPHRYRLLFAAPLPGYDAHAAPLVAASQEAMNVLLEVLAGTTPGAGEGRPGQLDRQVASWLHDRHVTTVTPMLARQAVVIWSRLHGLVSLEIDGNFASMGLDPKLLFEYATATLSPSADKEETHDS
jgi:AcrR family transcriptional regulator